MRLVGKFTDNQEVRMELAEMVGPTPELNRLAREVLMNIHRLMIKHHDTGRMRTRIRLERVRSAGGKKIDYEIINRDPAAVFFEFGHKQGKPRDKKGRYRKRKWVEGTHVMQNGLRNTRRGTSL